MFGPTVSTTFKPDWDIYPTNHEYRPSGVAEHIGWKNAAATGMGCDPRKENAPSYWPGVAKEDFKAIVSWFVIYRAESGHTSTNTGVEIGTQTTWMLSKSKGNWTKVQSNTSPYWFDAYAENAIDQSPYDVTSRPGPVGIILSTEPGAIVHGGLSRVTIPLGLTDIAAIVSTVQHRSAKINAGGADDSANSRLIVQCGVDYYPHKDATLADMAPATWVPGAGVGRFIQAKPEWRTSMLMLCADDYSESDFVSNPPPILST